MRLTTQPLILDYGCAGGNSDVPITRKEFLNQSERHNCLRNTLRPFIRENEICYRSSVEAAVARRPSSEHINYQAWCNRGCRADYTPLAQGGWQGHLDHDRGQCSAIARFKRRSPLYLVGRTRTSVRHPI